MEKKRSALCEGAKTTLQAAAPPNKGDKQKESWPSARSGLHEYAQRNAQTGVIMDGPPCAVSVTTARARAAVSLSLERHAVDRSLLRQMLTPEPGGE